MTTTLAVLLLGLLIATCVIAYLADTLGKNLGKKRISLLGMRPRTTATVISMGTSVGIMLFTVAILLIANKSISNALLHYDEKVKEANDARREAQRLTDELKTKNEKTRQQIATAESRLKISLRELKTTDTQLVETRVRLTQAQKARSAAERSAAQAKASARVALTRYSEAKRAYEALRNQLQGARQRVVQAQRLLQAEQRHVNETNLRLRNAQNSLATSRRQAAGARQQLQEAVRRRTEASQQLVKLQGDLKQTQDRFQQVEDRLKKNLEDYAVAQNQLAEIETKQQALEEAYKARLAAMNQVVSVARLISTGQISLRQGTVIRERTIEASSVSSDIRDQLQALVEEAGKTLAASNRTIELAPVDATIGGKEIRLQGDDVINSLAEYIATFDVPVSVRLVAARDHAIKEDKVFASFLPVPVRTIYKEGETLAETDITPGSDARIFNQLLALLNNAEAIGRAKGMNPLLTDKNQFFFVTPGTNELVFETIRNIQADPARAHVKLVAARDLNTVEPLQIRFEVSRKNFRLTP